MYPGQDLGGPEPHCSKITRRREGPLLQVSSSPFSPPFQKGLGLLGTLPCLPPLSHSAAAVQGARLGFQSCTECSQPKGRGCKCLLGVGQAGRGRGVGRGSGFQGCGQRADSAGTHQRYLSVGLERIRLVFNSFLTSILIWLPNDRDLGNKIFRCKIQIGQN